MPLSEPYRRPEVAESALRLLRAEYEVTPFQSRDELTVLSGWCDTTLRGGRTCLAVVTGRGGAGKTRLALELVARRARDGWYTGVLREHTGGGESLEWLARVTAPLLVMIDYADARASSVIDVLQVVARRPRPAVVVLTARERQGEWLTRITDALETDSHPCQLETLDLPDAHPRRGDVFARTYSALSGGTPGTTDTTGDRGTGRRLVSLPVPAKGTRWTTLDLVLLGWLAARQAGASSPTGGANGCLGGPGAA
jgi:hypothetical protein